jgi:hypothetical protein
MVSIKEKRELALIFSAVILVVLVGIIVVFIGSRSVGLAVDINVNQPNYAGFVHLLENNGEWVPAISGKNCNDVCGTKICVPLQQTCSSTSQDFCRCYEVPK